jgi:hypothetical protein
MLGWHVSVYRQKDGGRLPATAKSEEGARLAVWQADVGGLKWIHELVKAGKAVDLLGNGYPNRYTAAAENLIPHLSATPPLARTVWQREEGDIVTDQWVGKTATDPIEITQCRPDEWLLIEAWDES